MVASNLNPARQKLPALSSSRRLTAIGLFSALTLVINLSRISIPAPFAGFLSYEVWEIPIVVALLLFGVSAAISVSVINVVGLLLIQPGALPSGPFYNLAATLTMFVGIVIGHRFSNRMSMRPALLVTAATALGLVTRTVGMVIFNGIFLPFPPPVGFGVSQQALPPLLVLIAVFNATLALYTIPISYWVVKAILPRYPFRIAFPLKSDRAIK